MDYTLACLIVFMILFVADIIGFMVASSGIKAKEQEMNNKLVEHISSRFHNIEVEEEENGKPMV
jgi:HD superfamily phosphohydrolase YqeK